MLCGVAVASQAQEVAAAPQLKPQVGSSEVAFGQFRVDMGLGYGKPLTDGYNAGMLLHLEPKLEILRQIAVGVRWDGTLFAGVKGNLKSPDLNNPDLTNPDDPYGTKDNNAEAKISFSSGWMLTGDFYLTNTYFRPFVGAGAGLYSGGSASGSISGTDAENKQEKSTNKPALMFRGGLDFGHTRLSVSYNMASATPTFSYIGFNLGWYIGGGKK